MKPLSRKALLVKGALMAALPGAMAKDAKSLDLDKLLAGVAADNFRKHKPEIIAAIKPVLAKDADLQGFHSLLDSMDKPGNTDHDMGKDLDNVDGVAEDDHPVIAMLRGKVDDATLKQVQDMLNKEEEEEGEGVAQDDTDPLKAKSETQEPNQRALATEKQVQPAMDKKAFDAAIAKASADTEKRVMERMGKIQAAKDEVRPYVGEVLGMDSAEAVFKYALDTLGVDVKGVDASAYAAILKAQPKPGYAAPRIGMDSAAATGFAAKFPDAARIKQVH